MLLVTDFQIAPKEHQLVEWFQMLRMEIIEHLCRVFMDNRIW